MHPTSSVFYAKRIFIGIETSPGWSSGCMIHGVNGIYIGDYTQTSQNVAILSGNHDPYDLRTQLPARPIRIGKYCLLGMNCVILPQVELGDYTIVGANSVVKDSFPDGFVVIAGSPARVVRRLDPALRKDRRSMFEYNGYIRNAEFEEFSRSHLVDAEAVLSEIKDMHPINKA
jgi:acetyltransferase-like isoleucine patch superfamily enzyme